MTSTNQCKKMDLSLFCSGPTWPLLIILILPIATLSNCFGKAYQYQVYYHLPVTTADFLIFQKENWFFSFLLISLFLLFLQNENRRNFDVNYVLRMKSRRQILLSQLVRAAVYALLFSLYYTVCTLIIAPFFSSGYINWSSTGSIFYSNTAKLMSVSFLTVLLIFAIMCFLCMLAASYLFMFFCWFSKKGILPWLVIIFLFCWDIFMERYAVLAQRASITFSKWSDQTLWQGALVEIMIAAVFGITGAICAKRKEFLN